MTARKPMNRTLVRSSSLTRGRALAPAQGRSTGSTKPGEWIAGFMVKYLNRPEYPDPYVIGYDYDDPTLVPSFVMMTDARRLPAGSWLVHYTDQNPFTSFERGATFDTPLWYTKEGSRGTRRAKCPGNLSEKIDDVVFGFAFRAVRRSYYHHHYGDNAVLFRCDVAVEFYHKGDDYEQVLFPICSEYDAIPIYLANQDGGGEVDTVNGRMDFDTAADIIKAFDGGKIKREGRALGTTRKGRWHPLVALPRGAK